MANYLHTALFFCDKALPGTSKFSLEDLEPMFEQKLACFRAESRHGHVVDCIAAMLAAKGAKHSHLDFIASKGKWPYAAEPGSCALSAR